MASESSMLNVNQAPASKGFLSGLFGGSSRVDVPLTDPLPGVVLPEHAEITDMPKTEMTTLSNGLKIASENTPVRVWRAVDGTGLGRVIYLDG